MVNEYRLRFYTPAAELGLRLRGMRGKAAVNLARWKKLVQSRWPGVRLEPRIRDDLRALVATNGIPAQSIAVEVECADGTHRRLRLAAGDHEQAEFLLDGGPDSGFRSLRAYPQHELLAHPYEIGLMIRVELASS
jgi:hypothetical protein